MAWSYPWEKNRNPLVIPAGAMRNQVQIQKQSTVPDPYGGPVDSWTAVLTARAYVATLSSRESYLGSQFTSEVTHQVAIWWPGPIGIAAGMRVVMGARMFAVQAVENVQEANRVLKLMCLEIDGVAS